MCKSRWKRDDKLANKSAIFFSRDCFLLTQSTDQGEIPRERRGHDRMIYKEEKKYVLCKFVYNKYCNNLTRHEVREIVIHIVIK